MDGSIGHDRLLRVRFPADVPGGLPVYQGATAVVGRPFGSIDADVAEHSFTLDNPAHEWFGTGSTARVSWTGPVRPGGAAGHRRGRDHPARTRFSGRQHGGPVTDLVAALAGQGVTATCSWPDGPRYGALDLDSNLPDVRIALGGPEQNPWTARLLEAVDPFGGGAQPGAGARACRCGCRPRSPGPRRSRPAPTCAGRGTCRCCSWPARTWPRRSAR